MKILFTKHANIIVKMKRVKFMSSLYYLNFILLIFIAFVIGCSDDDTDENFVCGYEITDTYGNAYKTVQIGDYCWMAENLNSGEFENAGDTQKIGEKWCFYNNPDECYARGGLYQYDKAICPSGWHIPTDDEWKETLNYVDSTFPLDADVDINSYSPDNAYYGDTIIEDISVGGISGFNHKQVGEYAPEENDPWITFSTSYWSSTPGGGDNIEGWAYYINDPQNGIFHLNVSLLDSLYDHGRSVRCIKDHTIKKSNNKLLTSSF